MTYRIVKTRYANLNRNKRMVVRKGIESREEAEALAAKLAILYRNATILPGLTFFQVVTEG